MSDWNNYMNKQYQMAGNLSNLGSSFYKQAGNNLMNSMNRAAPTLNSLIGAQTAGGLGWGAASAIGNQQMRANTQKNSGMASNALGDLFMQGQQQAGNMYSKLADLWQQDSQFKASQPSGWETAFGIAAPLLGTALGGPLGGALGGLFGGAANKGGGSPSFGSVSNLGNYPTMNTTSLGNWGYGYGR